MFSFFEFLYNNFIIIGIVLASLLASIILFRTVLKEFLFNRQLNLTQNVLRNFSSLKIKRPSLRPLYKVVLPLLIPVVFVLGVVRNPIVYDGHINQVHSKEDMFNLHENFNSKFYSTTLRTTDDIDSQAIRDAQFQKKPNISGDYDYVRVVDDYIVTLRSNTIEVTEFSSEDLEHKLSFPVISEEYDNVELLGLTKNGSNIIVFGTKELQSEESNHRYTFAKVYDSHDDFNQIHSYKMSGNPSNISFNENRLILVSQQYLPFYDDDFEIDNYLPHLIHNDTKDEQMYSTIRHIEGTRPENFVTIFHINFSELDYDYQTIFTDYENETEIFANSVYLSSTSYEFKQISDYLELEDPVEKYHTQLSKINVNPNKAGVHYFRTNIVSGSPTKEQSLFVDRDLTMVFTENKDNEIHAFRFSNRLDIWHDTKIDGFDSIKSIERFNDALIITDSEQQKVGFNISLPSSIQSLDVSDFEYPAENVIMKDEDIMLTMHMDDGRIFVTPHSKHGDSYVYLDYYQINMATFRINTLTNYYSLNDIYYRNVANILIIPRVITTNGENDEYTTEIREYSFNRSNYDFDLQSSLILPESMHSINPFVYRLHTRGNYSYHITPLGVALTHRDNPTEIIDFIAY